MALTPKLTALFAAGVLAAFAAGAEDCTNCHSLHGKSRLECNDCHSFNLNFKW